MYSSDTSNLIQCIDMKQSREAGKKIKKIYIYLLTVISWINVASRDSKGFSLVFIIVFHGNRHTPFSKIRKSFTEFYNMYLYHQQLQQTVCLNSIKENKGLVSDLQKIL